MSGSIAHSRASERPARTIWSALALSALLVGCRPDSEAAAPQVRPVRIVTVEKHEAGSPVTLTGRLEAKDEVALGFRISGRLLENRANLGDQVKPGDRTADQDRSYLFLVSLS
jgi:multidrug efflux pump subunit AcrA (membrane-fusion protein)